MKFSKNIAVSSIGILTVYLMSRVVFQMENTMEHTKAEGISSGVYRFFIIRDAFLSNRFTLYQIKEGICRFISGEIRGGEPGN